MKFRLLLFTLLAFSFACQTNSNFSNPKVEPLKTIEQPKMAEIASPEIRKLLESAVEQTKITKNYTQEYYVIPYPNGDVPIETGACTDVVIRAFRNVGIDLQKEVHEDIARNFSLYPQKWGLASPDTNIDHRRVPNLQTFFTRRGKSLKVTRKRGRLQAGRHRYMGH